MATSRNRTRRNQIKPLGVAERLADAPPSHYIHGATGSTRPAGADTYVVQGEAHRFDGACHEECENVR